jgi:hypothetical protein
MAPRRGANGPEVALARNASAPGQIAKAMIAEATANGAELPANIQGKAASAIAHGVNMETFFAAFMPAVEPPADDVAGDVAGDLPADGESAPPGDADDAALPAPESGEAPPPAPASDGETTVANIIAVVSSYQAAATLLEPLVEPESGEVV